MPLERRLLDGARNVNVDVNDVIRKCGDVVPEAKCRLCHAKALQILQELPDEEFSIMPGGPNSIRLVCMPAEAVSLPAVLRVKWIPAACLRVLDLSSPADFWGDDV